MSGEQPTRWGFHRLSGDWARRLVARAALARGDLVVDVGAGAGVITAELVAAGARVLAVERHPGRARELRARFDGSPVTVVQADAADLRLPRRPFHVVANPPFAVTTALLRRLLHPGSRLVRAELVVPVPVAARWAAGRGARRPPADHFVVRRGLHVPRHAFRPPPPAPVATLVLEAAAHTGRLSRRSPRHR